MHCSLSLSKGPIHCSISNQMIFLDYCFICVRLHRVNTHYVSYEASCLEEVEASIKSCKVSTAMLYKLCISRSDSWEHTQPVKRWGIRERSELKECWSLDYDYKKPGWDTLVTFFIGAASHNNFLRLTLLFYDLKCCNALKCKKVIFKFKNL